MLRVGLTGGIGAGKSMIAGRLFERGAVLVDADAIAREVVEPGTDGLADVVEAFGEGILDSTGALSRPALAAVAFANEEARNRLNSIIHPRIGRRTAELMNAAEPDAIVVHDIPLLVEAGLAANYHLAIVVDAPEEVRVARLHESRGMSERDAMARIAAQATEQQRRAAADVWLDNDGTYDDVLSEVDKLWTDRLMPYEANVRLRRPRMPQPPKIVAYDETWPAQAERIIARIRAAIGDRIIRVDHVGSTAVPGLPAKDVIDLQVVVETLAEADLFADVLSDAGFPLAEGELVDVATDRVSAWPKRFHFGGDPCRPVNLQVRSLETPAWRLALLFVAWLRANDDERAAYRALKRDLARKHAGGSTTDYADDKQQWVRAAFVRAEEWAARTDWSP